MIDFTVMEMQVLKLLVEGKKVPNGFETIRKRVQQKLEAEIADAMAKIQV